MKPLIAAALLGFVSADAQTTRGVIDIANLVCPADAMTLIGEKGHELIHEEEGKETKWVFGNGILTASPVWDSLVTKESYNDFIMHVEFNVNKTKNPKNLEADGNSGIYIQNRYELQIHNSHGIPEEDFTAAYGGSLYKLKKPDRLVAKPHGEWQTYVIVFRAARFEGGKKNRGRADHRLPERRNDPRRLLHPAQNRRGRGGRPGAGADQVPGAP